MLFALPDNRLGFEGVKHVISILLGNPSLVRLNLRGTYYLAMIVL